MFRKLKGGVWQWAIIANVVLLLVNSFMLVNSVNSTQPDQKDYPWLSKRIFAEKQSDIIINFTSLREELRNYIHPLGTSLGLYFEYLPSGVSIGINEGKEIRLASLAKVPTVMATYHLIYEGKLSEDQQLTITEKNLDPTFGNLWEHGKGANVTVAEAARLSIVDSDNTAHNVLIDAVPIEEINAVYESLDIRYDEENGHPIISAKSYSSILRALYLSSYLPKHYSNKILEIMTSTKYTDKIPAQLPPDIKVAHKIGVYERKEPSTSAFSDCGIVYFPDRPFLLCMMAEGDENGVRQHMSQIAKMIYEYIASVTVNK